MKSQLRDISFRVSLTVLLTAFAGGVINDLAGQSDVVSRSPTSSVPAGSKHAKGDEAGKTITIDLGGGVKMEFVRIPKGKFLMGSPKDEEDRDDHEQQHEVEITRDFYLAKFPTTQQQYEAIIGSNPSYFSKTGKGKDNVAGIKTSRFPVEHVSWEDAVQYCEKLSEKHGSGKRHFRLPTEAEWEYACRGGTKTPFYFGSSCNGTQANCDGKHPYGTDEEGPFLDRPCEVGSYESKSPHPWGLCDMIGNVTQWCQDWFAKDYYGKSPKKDPQGPDSGEFRLVRGGAWLSFPFTCRAANRKTCRPSHREEYIGFRVAFSVD